MQEYVRGEHRWLERLVGNWHGDFECRMKPDEPMVRTEAHETGRSLGELWVVLESEGEMPEGGCYRNAMTLGFDVRKGRFVGTFVSSAMSNLWVYEGALDDSATRLTLETEGPDFSGGSGLFQYRDVVEIQSDSRRTLRSFVLGREGSWQHIMTASYRREEASK